MLVRAEVRREYQYSGDRRIDPQYRQVGQAWSEANARGTRGSLSLSPLLRVC